MPNRIIREAILSSERIASLGWPEEVFYRRLMSVVDDYGRTEANLQLLRARCYPLQTDLVRVADISRWMAATAQSGLILYYEVAGKHYLELSNFQQQQRSPSKHPPPPTIDSTCEQVISDAHLGVVVFEVEGVGEPARKRATHARRPSGTALPADFAISERVRSWAQSKGYDRLQERFEHFVSTAKAKGYVYVDWDEAFMNAIRKDWAALGAIATAGPSRRVAM